MGDVAGGIAMRSLLQRLVMAVAVIGLVAVEVRQVGATSCTLATNNQQPTSKETNSAGSFSESIGVDWARSPGSGTWKVHYSSAGSDGFSVTAAVPGRADVHRGVRTSGHQGKSRSRRVVRWFRQSTVARTTSVSGTARRGSARGTMSSMSTGKGIPVRSGDERTARAARRGSALPASGSRSFQGM